MLSVVIPAYNEAGAVPRAAQRIGGVLQGEAIPYELIFVDDGSSDGTWEEIALAVRFGLAAMEGRDIG